MNRILSFFALGDVSTNQSIVKDTMRDLIAKQKLLVTATILIVNTPRTTCIYFLPKIHKEIHPGGPKVSAYWHTVALPKSFQTSYTKLWRPLSNHYLRTLTTVSMLSEFHDFNFFGEQKFIFTMDIKSLTLLFLMMKVF